MAHDYKSILDKLPKPISKEEQYLYSLVMAAANEEHTEPFNSPFYRMEKYWHAFYQIMSDRYIYIVPSNDTVGEKTLQSNSVTTAKLSTDVESKLLGTDRVTSEMIADNAVGSTEIADGSINTDKIVDGSVTRTKLSSNVSSLLLGENAVQTSYIADGSITAEKLSAELRKKLKV